MLQRYHVVAYPPVSLSEDRYSAFGKTLSDDPLDSSLYHLPDYLNVLLI